MKLKRLPGITLALICAIPLSAQETISTEESGGFIVRFLEDSLSSDNRAVDVVGLTGTFSSLLQIERLTISDADGVWLVLEGAELDWNRTALLRGDLNVNELSAERIAVLRRPLPTPVDPTLPTPEATEFKVPELPISVALNTLRADRIELGAPLVGQDSIWTLNGGLSLANGALKTTLDLSRLDRDGDALNLDLDIGTESNSAKINLTAHEAAGGIVGSFLPLAAEVPLDLSLKGSGPVSDFRADLNFATADLAQLQGTVAISATGPADRDTDTPNGLIFSADLNGDLDALIPEDYRSFFGPDLRLRVKGEQFESVSGAQGIALHSLAMSSRALRLSGTAVLEDGQLETANLRATIKPDAGQQHVVLPVAGGETIASEINLVAQKPKGADWGLTADLFDFETTGLAIEAASVQLKGEIDQASHALSAVTNTKLTGLRFEDPALSEALGGNLTLDTRLMADQEGFAAHDIQIGSQGYKITGNVSVDSWANGLKISPDLLAEVSDLSRLSKLAGTALSGSATTQISGAYAPLSGAFEATIGAATTNLATGQAQLDPLIGGAGDLRLLAIRDRDGLSVEDFALKTTGVTITAKGNLSSEDGNLTIQADIADLAPIVPQVPGPLKIVSQVARAANTFTGQVSLIGPHSSELKLLGTADLGGNADLDLVARLERLERFVPQLTGTLTAKGSATRSSGLWNIDLDARGPSGVTTQIAGSWDETDAKADVTATGNVHLGIANLFIAPNLLNGEAQFDLALRGTPGLNAISGQIQTNGSRLVLPDARQQLEDIEGQIRIANSSAQINLNARPRDGGQIRIGGPVKLTGPFLGDLRIGLGGVVLTDNLVYKTTLDGDLRLSGPLTQNPVLTGRIDVNETNINIASAGGAVDAAPIPEIRHVAEPASSYKTRKRAGLTQSSGTASSDSKLGLDLVINAPKRIFARGRGLRAELGGSLHIRGSASRPEPSGQINLIRGSFDILGRRLNLDEGQISLVGSLVPFLDFSASSSTSEGTATLRIAGPMQAPRIEVTAEPNRPSEEALALLLFGDNVQDLSPLALARLAASAARLSGRGLGTTQKLAEETGVDDVDIGFDNLGTGQLGLGGYAAENLYTDFNVNTLGESELSINLDLNPSLSVSGTVDSSGETGIGLFFKRDY